MIENIPFQLRARAPRAYGVACLIVLIAMMFSLFACDENPPPSSSQPPVVGQTPSMWRNVGPESSLVVAVENEANDAELAAALRRARSTADQARRQWELASDAGRARWAVKWAAPAADEKTEHVWVQPINWSRFRVEGTLVTDPRNELESGKARGDIVNFPIEELSDWIHFHTDDPTGPFDGGFTVQVLEKRFGTPPAD